MKLTTQLISCVFAAALSFVAVAHAEEEPGTTVAESMDLIEGEGVKAGAINTQVIQKTARVMAIDYENRTVVLEGGEGESIELEVGEEAVNFKQIQTGDMVIAEYLESVALFATEPGSGESAQIASAVALAVEGEMPGGIIADTLQVTAVVEAIDYETRTVTLKGPLRTTTMHVDERAKRFDNIKQGDEVHFVYTEAVAISVTKAEADKE